jgi:WS/DGAT/MGAT family acyltransferase
MEQLSGADSVFLAMETPIWPQHVGGLTILDPTGVAGFGFEAVRRVTAERMRLAPRYTQRLREVPLGLDRAYFVDVPDFDPREQIRRIAVPTPGGIRELAELAAYLMSRPLDRRRPLWEMWYIEGAAQGRVAMVMKSHHCLMDGMAASGIGELLCDLSPDPAARTLPEPPERHAGEPSALGMALRASLHAAQRPAAFARFAGRILSQAAGAVAARARGDASALPLRLPALRMNGVPGPERGFACATVPIARVKALKKRYDVTVNDVVLALSGSALRRYLLARGELPESPLVAVIAVSKRAEGDTTAGNQITTASVGWATDVADPVERLQRIHEHAARAKAGVGGLEGDFLRGLGESFAPGALNLMMRTLWPAFAGPFPGHVVVSNVRGTPVPLYIAGAPIEAIYPLSILAPGQGLNITVMTYRDRVDVGFTVAPELVPDAWSLAEGIPLALDELEQGRPQGREAAAQRAEGERSSSGAAARA